MWRDYSSPLQTERSIPWQVVEVNWCDVVKSLARKAGCCRDASGVPPPRGLLFYSSGGGGLLVRDNKK